ncbi:MAG: hypothetical protein JW892_12010 [Anaerolineae bacterium]|nr:hypothetical protein [Anaerolineae bacterium]
MIRSGNADDDAPGDAGCGVAGGTDCSADGPAGKGLGGGGAVGTVVMRGAEAGEAGAGTSGADAGC